MDNFFARLRHNLPSILKNGLIIVVIIGISATVIYFSKVSQQKQDVKKSFAEGYFLGERKNYPYLYITY